MSVLLKYLEANIGLLLLSALFGRNYFHNGGMKVKQLSVDQCTIKNCSGVPVLTVLYEFMRDG